MNCSTPLSSNLLGSNDNVLLHGFTIRAYDTTYHVGAVKLTGLGKSGCMMSMTTGFDTISTFFVPNKEQPLVVSIRIANTI